MKQQKSNRCVVLFSGGIESTNTVLRMIKRGYLIDLLTYDNGCMTNIEMSSRRANEIKRKFRDKIGNHLIINFNAIFKI